jgi:hypothetical protein
MLAWHVGKLASVVQALSVMELIMAKEVPENMSWISGLVVLEQKLLYEIVSEVVLTFGAEVAGLTTEMLELTVIKAYEK